MSGMSRESSLMKILNLFGRYDAQLIEAAAWGNAKAVKKALKHANPNAKKVGDLGFFAGQNAPRNEDTPIMAAARNGHAECVRILAPVSDLQTQHNTNWESALFVAAERGYLACVQALLECPQAHYLCKMMTLDRGDTALGIAAARGNAECVKALLPLSIPGKLNSECRTPLCLAVSECLNPSAAMECAALLAPDTKFPSLTDIRPTEHGKKPQIDPRAEAV